MNLKEYYLKKYPDDELGAEINSGATSSGLLNVLYTKDGNHIYDYLSVHDSVIRERMFEALSDELNVPYDYVYTLWIKKQTPALPADYLAECLGAALRGADVERIEREAFTVYPFIKTDISFDEFLARVHFYRESQ